MDYGKILTNFQEEDVLEIDFRDLLAHLCYKWRRICLIIVVGCLIGLLFWLTNSKKTETNKNKITQENIDLARAELSEDEAQQAEYLFAQYVSYLDYRKSIQKYLSDSLYSANDYAGNMALRALYYVNSDIGNVNQIFTRIALGTDEYDKIAKIMKKDNTMLDDVYRRVRIDDINSLVTNRDEYSYILEDSAEKEQKKTLLEVYLVAESRSQADAVMDVVRDAFDKQIEELKVIDPDINMVFLGENYSTDISDFLSGRQSDAVSKLNAINDQINALETNYVNRLAGDTRAYYQLMKGKKEQEIIPVKKPSLLKYVIIGAILGFAISLCCIVMQYIFDGKVKTSNELRYLYYSEMPSRICRKKQGYYLFGNIARLCTGTEVIDESVQTDLAASDISIKLKKKGINSVYLSFKESSNWQKQATEEIIEYLKKRNESIEIKTGDPISASQELEIFSGSEAAILMTELKATRRNDWRRWISLCERYELPIVGIISLEEC